MIRRTCTAFGISRLRKQMFPVSGESVCCCRTGEEKQGDLAPICGGSGMGDATQRYHTKHGRSLSILLPAQPTTPLWEDPQMALILR